ncbi:MAG: hypothetical protein ABI594_02520 [Ginsengibacter sp.]
MTAVLGKPCYPAHGLQQWGWERSKYGTGIDNWDFVFEFIVNEWGL